MIERLQLIVATPWYVFALHDVRNEEHTRSENEERSQVEWAEEQYLEEEDCSQRAERRRECALQKQETQMKH